MIALLIVCLLVNLMLITLVDYSKVESKEDPDTDENED